MAAPLPSNELERLDVLAQCAVLDTDPEKDFDDIVRLAAQICGMPVAAVSLIDDHRQWFKAITGLVVAETPREVAFCAHTILQTEVFLVPDTLQDSRFADNPLVTGDPDIRFYAGAPIVTPDGYALGALCVLDHKPRTLTAEQQDALRTLSRQAAGQMELRRQIEAQKGLVAVREQAQAQVQEQVERFETAVGAMQNGLVVQDAEGAIRVCNAAAERILGLTADQMMGRTSLDARWSSVREDMSDFPGAEHPALLSLRTGESFQGVIMGVHKPEGELVWISINSAPLIHSYETRPHGVVVTFEDVTERKTAEDARARMAAIVASSLDAVTAMTLEGALVIWSPGAEQIYGFTAAEMIGRHASVLAGPDQTSPVSQAIARLRRGEVVPPVEVIRQRKDGSRIDVLLTFTGIKDAGGQLIGVAGIGRDITNRKQTEAALAESETRLRQLSDAAFEGIAVSQNGRLADVNSAFLRLFGYDTVAEVEGREVGQFAAPESLSLVLQKSSQNEEALYEAVCRRRDGSTFQAELQGRRSQWQGKPARVTAVRDISERKAAEEAVQRAEDNYRSIFENAIDGIFQTSPEGRVLRANPALAQMLGYESPEELICALTDLRRQLYLNPAERDLFLARLRAKGSITGFEVLFRRKNGSTLWASMNARLVKGSGEKRHIEGTIEDITARREAEQQVRDYAVVLEAKMTELAAVNDELERLATTDGLTGLKNNRLFHERLTEEFQRASRYGQPLSLLMLDVDCFKQYNDAFGHPAGDAVLRQVAQVLRMCSRGTDLAARYGGEEFVVILPQTDSSGAFVIAERIRAAIAAGPWEKRGVTVSIGTAALEIGVANPDRLIALADTALYRSKDAGRNQVTHSRALLPESAAETTTAA